MLHLQSEPRAEERRAYRIPDFCWRYGVSRSMAYKLAKEGRLRLVKIGAVASSCTRTPRLSCVRARDPNPRRAGRRGTEKHIFQDQSAP
jgi:hypothetical protein